jgi:hypothetical protein
MDLSEVLEAAKTQAAGLPSSAAELEKLRLETQQYFGTIPEPPLYRRANDPVRLQAPALIAEGQGLLARLYAADRERPDDGARALIDAVEAHLGALIQTRDGRLEQAEQAYLTAMEREKKALSVRRAWVRTDEEVAPIFDRQTGASRFDPRAEAQVRVRLACPDKACHQIAEYAFSPAYSTQRFVCQTCRTPFIVFFGEAREGEIEQAGGGKRYTLKLEELGGAMSRVQFEDSAGADFHVARRDLLALLYTEDRDLRGVLNLTTSRLLWLPKGGPCFLATAAYGEGAKELVTFRRFRDEVLQRSAAGALLVRGYYRVGPALARPVKGPLRPLLRFGLETLRRRLDERAGLGPSGERAFPSASGVAVVASRSPEPRP